MRALPKSELEWTLAEYQAEGQEAPDRILEQPSACEGELMSDAEIEDHINDSIMTLRLLDQKGSAHFERVQDIFFADLAFLYRIGRLAADDYNELIKAKHYHLQ